MPTFHAKNLWEDIGTADMVIITTNSYISRKGELVMGRGIALEAKGRYPELPKLFAKHIPHLGVYGLVVVKHQNKLFGAFQVKRHFKDRAELGLIKTATEKLKRFLEDKNLHIIMNFPGIGYGRLSDKRRNPVCFQDFFNR